MSISHFRELRVWQLGQDIALDIYRLSKEFPREELFSLSSQIRRAAVSIPSNIAEGFNRKSKREFGRFLLISLGSCAEVETQLELANKLGYIKEESLKPALEKVDHESRMLKVLSDKFVNTRD